MRERSMGSLESLRRLNRLRVIGTLRDHGMSPRGDRPADRAVALHRLEPGRRPAGVRPRGRARGAAQGGAAGRPPAHPALVRPVGRRRARDRLRPPPRAVAVADLSVDVLAEGTARSTSTTRRTKASTPPPRSSTTRSRRRGVDRLRVIGAGRRASGADRPRDGMIGSSAILPGWVGVRAVEEMRAGSTSRSWSTTTRPRRARGGRLRRRSRRRRLRLRDSPRASAPG